MRAEFGEKLQKFGVIPVGRPLFESLRLLVANIQSLDAKRKVTHRMIAEDAFRTGLVEICKAYGLESKILKLGEK